MSECHNDKCIMEDRIRQIEKKQEKYSQEHGVFYDRLRNLDLKVQETALKSQNVMEKLDEISSDVKDSRKDIEELKNQPGNMVGKFKTSIISSIGSCLGGGIVALIAYSLVNMS